MDYENIKILFISLTALAFALVAYIILLWNYYRKKHKQMEEAEKEWIKDKFTFMHGTLKANHEMQMLKLGTIDNKVEKINGDVKKLKEVTNTTVHEVDKLKEKTNKHDDKIERYGQQTKKARFFESNPVILILVILGAIAAINYKSIIDLIKLIF